MVAFLLRQHLFERLLTWRLHRWPEGFSSKRAAYYGRLFVSVNTLFDELEVLREVVELTQAQKHLAYIKRQTPLREQRGFR